MTMDRGLGIEDLLGAQRAAVLDLAARHGARNVRVFGSVARGEARPDSDIDLLVELEAGRSLMDLAGLLLDLEDLLGRRVDIGTEAALKPRIRRQVMSEAIPL